MMMESNCKKRLLVFNCHEAWVYQLGWLGYGLDIIVGLKGQKQRTWDRHMRPLPANCRLLGLKAAIESPVEYECIITHNFTDLLDIKTRSEPRMIVLHSTLEGRVLEEKTKIAPDQMRGLLKKYIAMTGTHAVAVSELKGRSWQQVEDIVPFGIDTSDYLPWTGEKAAGLRICNYISSRKDILLWDFHEKAFSGFDVTLVGHNPDIENAEASGDWGHLKEILQKHRFYIHTADPLLEDGYNMATFEAMAAGLAVLGNCHPSSLIEHGVNGFVSDDPRELRRYAMMLLEDRELAFRMGQAAKRTVMERFSKDRFCESFRRSIAIAQKQWRGVKVG